MGVNLRNTRYIPISKNRRRGAYKVTSTLEAGTITLKNAKALEQAVGNAIRDLNLMGVVTYKYVIS